MKQQHRHQHHTHREHRSNLDIIANVLKLAMNVPSSNQQRKITSNNIDKNDQYDQDLTCMIESCDAIGEEVIALLDEASLSDVDKYDEHHDDDASQRNNFKNKERDNNNKNNNLIPAVVCRKHFDKLIEAYYCQERLTGVGNRNKIIHKASRAYEQLGYYLETMIVKGLPDMDRTE
jgi:hypothetical protein